MKKGIRKVNIKINFTNRWLYTFIAVGILALIGVGVYAFGAMPNPGHAISQLQTCDSNGQTLVMQNGQWICGTPTAAETDPTVPYRFGGTYKVNYGNGACGSANPYTGACSCPGGYSSQPLVSDSYERWSLYVCYK